MNHLINIYAWKKSGREGRGKAMPMLAVSTHVYKGCIVTSLVSHDRSCQATTSTGRNLEPNDIRT